MSVMIVYVVFKVYKMLVSSINYFIFISCDKGCPDKRHRFSAGCTVRSLSDTTEG